MVCAMMDCWLDHFFMRRKIQHCTLSLRVNISCYFIVPNLRPIDHLWEIETNFFSGYLSLLPATFFKLPSEGIGYHCICAEYAVMWQCDKEQIPFAFIFYFFVSWMKIRMVCVMGLNKCFLHVNIKNWIVAVLWRNLGVLFFRYVKYKLTKYTKTCFRVMNSLPF